MVLDYTPKIRTTPLVCYISIYIYINISKIIYIYIYIYIYISKIKYFIFLPQYSKKVEGKMTATLLCYVHFLAISVFQYVHVHFDILKCLFPAISVFFRYVHGHSHQVIAMTVHRYPPYFTRTQFGNVNKNKALF